MDGYPKIKYHQRGGGSICVVSAAQEKSLGPEWIDNRPPQTVAASPTLDIPAQEPIKTVADGDKKYGRQPSKRSI